MENLKEKYTNFWFLSLKKLIDNAANNLSGEWKGARRERTESLYSLNKQE